MNGPLKITGIQSELYWEDPKANHSHLMEKLHQAPKSDAYILPEMFSTGFSMETEKLAEPMEGPTHSWMKSAAVELNGVVAGSVIIRDNGKFYNRFLWVAPDGSTAYYDKRHRFTMADEHHHFNAGNEHTIVELKGWRIMLQVCYDLRFPVWSRNRKNYDALIYVANWPAARAGAWSKLLLARAIENQCYVVGVNRVGTDGKDIPYSGDSAIIDAYGEYLEHATSSKEEILTSELSAETLVAFRKKFPVLEDGDGFELKG